MYKPKKILVTLTGGGFLWQARSLLSHLGNDYDYHFVTTHDSYNKNRATDIPTGEIHLISKITTIADGSPFKIVKNALKSFLDAYKVVKKVNPIAVICVGSSIAIPLCFWAKFFKKKAIFIESITRVLKPSLTGKIISTFRFCDRFYVQWPETVKLYRGALYKGTIL